MGFHSMIQRMRKRNLLKGATVICFDVRGCMAEDHRLKWIGRVTDFKANRLTTESAVVKIDKRDDGSGDSRDYDLGEEYPVVEDTSLQMIRPGLFFYFQ